MVDPVLTELARGYSNAEMIAEHLFPLVGNLAKEAGKIPQWSKEAFKLYNTERAIRAMSNRVNPEGTTPIVFALSEYDLEYPIDYREEDESMFGLEQVGVEFTMGWIQLQREKQSADLAQNPDNYATGSKLALSGSDQFTDPTSDPCGVIDDAKESIRQKIGRRPNTLEIGATTFKALKKHPQLIEKIKYSQKGIITLDLMKEIFDIDKLIVGEAVYADDAGTFHDIWGDSMTLAWVPGASATAPRSKRSPSYGYTLRKKGMPETDTRMENGGKLKVVRSTDNYDVLLVGAEAGFLVSNTNL